MINFLSSWVKNLSLSLIIVSMLEMILPNNKTKKYVKVVMELYILFSIISPFIKNSEIFNLESRTIDTYSDYIANSEIEKETLNQDLMDKQLKSLYEEELEKDIINKISILGYKIEECKVSANINKNSNGIEKITIKLGEKVNKKELENEFSIENKIVSEIQKIPKIDVSIKNKEKEIEVKKEDENGISKKDVEIIRDFLIKEYEVSEKCLKIN